MKNINKPKTKNPKAHLFFFAFVGYVLHAITSKVEPALWRNLEIWSGKGCIQLITKLL